MNEVSPELGSLRLYSSGTGCTDTHKPSFHSCSLDRELINFSTEVSLLQLYNNIESIDRFYNIFGIKKCRLKIIFFTKF